MGVEELGQVCHLKNGKDKNLETTKISSHTAKIQSQLS